MELVSTSSATKSDPVGALTHRIVQRTWDRVSPFARGAPGGPHHGAWSAPSYYVKQLVLEAIRESRAGMPAETVSMDITVGNPGELPADRSGN